MRLGFVKSPPDLSSRLSVLRGTARRRAFPVVVSVLAILAAFAGAPAPAQESSPDKPPDPKIVELIGRVRVEEAKYQDLEVVTRRSHRAAPGGRIHWTVRQQDETLDTVRQNGLFYAHVQIVRTLDGGAKRTQELVSAFDGKRTRTVEMGNSVNVHLRRYEPSQVVPPHSWALAAWQVNFDLSTFLGGMAALHKDRKVRRFRYQMGTIYEFNKLDFQWEGEETVDGLRCVKIHCQRQYTSRSDPAPAFVWLALDRNLICAKLQVFYRTNRDAPDVESVVKEWREIGPGLWLPARIHSEWKLAGQKVRSLEWDEDFTLESAKLHPDHPAAFFRDVPMPKDLPLFTIDEQGHLADDVLLHLKPAGNPHRRMQEVLDKIRENEALYRSFQATIETDYRVLSPNLNFGGAITLSQQIKRDVVRQGRRFRVSSHDEGHSSTGGTLVDQLSAFDGTWSRSLSVTEFTGNAVAMNQGGGELVRLPHGPQRYASLRPADDLTWSDLAPHLLPFDRIGLRSAATLADWLTAEVDTEYNQSKNEVTYLGSEIRDGLACDVLQLVTLFGGRADAMVSRRLIWVAKDRNYLPVRWEWREPRQNPTLPTGYTRIEALAEARTGVWFPQRIRNIAFVGLATMGEGLVEDRLIIGYRRDTVVRNFGLAPKRLNSEFRDVVVPAGTAVNVQDAEGKYVGRFKQEKAGVASLLDEEWIRLALDQLQQGLKHNEPRRDRQKRLAAANALVGKAPPELPRTWVNGKPLTWNDDLKGKTVLLYFWAMWDGNSCREAKRLSDQAERLKTDGIVVIGAHAMGTQPGDVDRAVKTFELNFPVCIDPPPREKLLAWGPLWKQFGVRSLPAAAVIDASGHVADFGAIDPMLVKARELARRSVQRN
jgi:peroxiredoxin